MFIFSPILVSAAVPAFPGAQGGGAASVGGRGGQVIEVTNLNDSGAGSLRACVDASGPRTCVFRVGGTIQLQSEFYITNPYLTVAGQTAPGGGILLSGKNISQNLVTISTHDVIWRYMRHRKGYTSGCPNGANCGSTLQAESRGYNVIMDHNSTSWNQDEGIVVWRGTTNPINNVTISSNLIAEGLASHSTGFAAGGATPTLSEGVTNIDFHHNLTMDNGHRNPLLFNKSSRITNNIYYNQDFYNFQGGGGIQADIIGNLYKLGPMNNSSTHEVQAFADSSHVHAVPGNPSLYLSGNLGWNQPSATGDQWLLTSRATGENGSQNGAIPSTWKRTSPLPGTTYPIVAEPVANIESSILPVVGASRRLACDGSWVANRDSVDTRLINQYQTNTGISALPSTEASVGGFPVIPGGTPCADADDDGMPDVWETARGLNPNNAADRNLIAASGYTYLEEYLNGTGTDTPPPPPPPPPSTNKFVIGNRVQVTTIINVRDSAGGNLLGTQPVGALGTVLAGPTQTPNGVIWWQIDYDNGVDGWSGEDYLVKYTAPPPPSDTTPPTVPTGLTAVVSASQVSLSWNASSDNVGVTGYRLYRNGTHIAAPASNSYIDGNLAPGTYSYTVAAVDAAGNLSAQSGSVSATVLLPPGRLRLSLASPVSFNAAAEGKT